MHLNTKCSVFLKKIPLYLVFLLTGIRNFAELELTFFRVFTNEFRAPQGSVLQLLDAKEFLVL